MKAGILTWFMGANYGAKAQSYALQQYVNALGLESCMIDFRPSGYKKVNIKSNINRRQAIKNPCIVIDGIKRCKSFSDTNKIYNLTKYCETAGDIDNLGLDFIIFGSDAIFNTRHPLCEPVYFGAGINKTKKIAYSPSCEYLNPDSRLSGECNESLKEFAAISVRDINTAKLVYNNIGKEVPITLDPTMLYDFKEIEADLPLDKYILIYSFSDWSIYSEPIRRFAKERNLKILAVGQRCKWADVSVSAASFELWISSFRRAEYVFTDSFHGTVFAIKNNKEIVLFGRNDKKSKIHDLTSKVGIQRDFYDGGVTIDEYLSEPVNYDDVNIKLKENIKYSENYLKAALTGGSAE